jgi:hypothetical protein
MKATYVFATLGGVCMVAGAVVTAVVLTTGKNDTTSNDSGAISAVSTGSVYPIRCAPCG